MTKGNPTHIKTIREFHRLRGLPMPMHPLISISKIEEITIPPKPEDSTTFFDFYFITIKHVPNAIYTYGQRNYDAGEGSMFFMSPKQVIGIDLSTYSEKPTGWVILIHPDFIWKTPLSHTIKHYEFFDYTVNEALFLSEKEEEIIHRIIGIILQEYHSNIDEFSQNIILSQIEVLLNYAERFYHRQFITRKKENHQLLAKLEKLLDDYFDQADLLSKGLPSVQYISESLNVSPGYLRSLLKVLTGQNT